MRFRAAKRRVWEGFAYFRRGVPRLFYRLWRRNGLFLVARGLRILQDFAGFCRAKFFIFFVFSGGLATHNP